MDKSLLLKFLSLSVGQYFKQEHIIRALTFHEIDTNSKYSISLGKFKYVISILLDSGFSFYNISDLNNENTKFKGNSIFITFDDSHISSLKGIDYLIKNKIKSTVFLIAKDYEKFVPTNRIPISQIISLKKNNIEIGCHSYSHTLLPLVSDLDKEITYAKKIIEKVIDAKIESFSLPYGKKNSFNMNILKKIKDAEFKTCCTQLPSPIYPKSNIFLIPRIGIWYNDDYKTIMRKINGNYDYLKYF